MPCPIMSSRKFLIIVGAVLALSCHRAPKPEITTNFDVQFEILNGKVKQLRETLRKNKLYPPDIYITNFDIYGNATRTEGMGTVLNYEYSYYKTGKKISVTEKDSSGTPHLYEYLYKYDVNGRIAEMSYNTNDLKVNPDTQLREEHFYVPKKDRVFYKYDAAGNRVEEDYYHNREQAWRETYKYSEKHLLIEEEYFYGDRKKPKSKTSYHYTSFDSKGNWLKRVGEVKDYGLPGQEIPEPVMFREITYY